MGLCFFGGFGVRAEDFEEELFVDHFPFLLTGGGQQVVG